MRILFIHQNMPGQFTHLMKALCEDPAHEVWALGEQAAAERCARVHPRIRILSYQMGAPETPPNPHAYLQDADAHVRRGQTVARALLQLKSHGRVPDLVVAHPGWGEALFVKDVFPGVPLLGYFEFFFAAQGADVGFDPEFPSSLDNALRLRMRNALTLAVLDACDAGVSPTRWQHSRFPAVYADRIHVLHEGVDTDLLTPQPGARFEHEGEVYLAGDPVISYVARNLEPYRGFHRFMRALPALLRAHPRARVIVVGGDGVSYGRKAPDGQTWRQRLMAEIDAEAAKGGPGAAVDWSRVRFTGKLPYAQYVQVLRVSAVHVYLTVPFVLSWSMLETMSCGGLMVASATAPVQEVIEDGVNGHLVDFFDTDALVERIGRALNDPAAQAPLRAAARATVVGRYDLKRHCLPQGLALLKRVAGG